MKEKKEGWMDELKKCNQEERYFVFENGASSSSTGVGGSGRFIVIDDLDGVFDCKTKQK